MRPLIVVIALLAADSNYGLSTEAINTSAFESVVNSGLNMPYPTAELKALSPTARATAIQQLGKLARAYYESPAFKTRYQEYVKTSRPPTPVPPQPYAKVAAEKKKELAAGKAKALESLSVIKDPAQHKQMQDIIEQGYAEQEKVFTDKQMIDTMEQQRFNVEKVTYEASVKSQPDDPNIKLKAQLKQFLADTADVDYAAKTTMVDSRSRFVNAAYEEKADLWKRAYRLGKPGAEAARAFAKEWLAALGK